MGVIEKLSLSISKPTILDLNLRLYGYSSNVISDS